MIRILNFSDLHLDHNPAYELPETFPPHDVVVVAGDLYGSPAQGIGFLANAPQLRDSKVLFVPGNHEFYGREITSSIAAGYEAASGTNVIMLHRTSTLVGGVTFVGATLWTDYKLFGDPEASMRAAAASMNDHRLIRTARDGREYMFSPRDARTRHDQERAELRRTLLDAGPGAVVVTHHAPHFRSVHRRYADDPVTPAFVSDLTGLIRATKPALWIHGHTHASFDYVVDRTRVVCNPKGYTRGDVDLEHENRAYDEGFVVEVPSPGDVPPTTA